MNQPPRSLRSLPPEGAVSPLGRPGGAVTDKILTRRDGAIAHIVFNNPDKLNAISLDMWQGLGDAMEGFEADPQVRVVVLTGAGDKAFVAGADVSKYEEERMGDNAQEHYAQTGERALNALYGSTKATIAAIDGYCIGGGISVAASCDLRIATTRSQFGQPAMRYGIGYRYKSLRRVTDLIGAAGAKDLLIGGAMFDAQEAYAKGLVGKVLPEAGFMEAVLKQAQKIAEGAPLTLRQVKYAIAQIVKDPEQRDLDEAERLFLACYASEDYREGIRAFAEKRKPVFKGV